MDEGHHFFAAELERLLELPLQPEEALRVWYEEARKLQQTLHQQYPGVEVPHEIWHFFSDADIRAKGSEAAYRDRQEAIVREFIDSLRGSEHAS
jgi:hypothetical protein